MTKVNFEYDKVVSLKLRYADCPSTRDFYCIDQATAQTIRMLAEQFSPPAWEKVHPSCWFRKEPKNSLWISKTSRGWLAVRPDRSGTEKFLSHLEYVMPILFPTPEMALSAAELCYPRPHPALSWVGTVPECMVEITQQGAWGLLGWERTLRQEAWAVLALGWDGKQASSIDEAEDAPTRTPTDRTNTIGVVH